MLAFWPSLGRAMARPRVQVATKNFSYGGIGVKIKRPALSFPDAVEAELLLARAKKAAAARATGSRIPGMEKKVAGKGGKGGGKGGTNKNVGMGKGGREAAVYATKLRRGPSGSAVEVCLAELVAGPVPHNVVHYAAAFHRLRELKQWRRALAVLEQLKNDSTVWVDCASAAGSSLEDVDARADADARQAASDPAFAWALQCRTKVRHLHNEALAGCAKAGLWETAFDLLESMRERSRSSTRQWKSSGSRGSGPSQALDSSSDGEDWSWMEPDARNYTAALTACAKAPGYGAAAKSQSERKKSTTTAPWEAALGLLSVMEERRDPLDQYAYHAAVSACARAQQWALVRGLVQRMQVRGGFSVTPATLDSALHPQSGVPLEAALAAARALGHQLEHREQLAIHGEDDNDDVLSQGESTQTWDFSGASNSSSSADFAASVQDPELLAALLPAALPSAYVKSRLLSLCRRDGAWQLAVALLDLPVLSDTRSNGNSFSFSHKGSFHAQRDAQASAVIGTTQVLQTLCEAKQWQPTLKLLDRVFDERSPDAQAADGGLGDGMGDTGQAVSTTAAGVDMRVDEVLLRVAAQGCVTAHGADLLAAAASNLEEEAGAGGSSDSSKATEAPGTGLGTDSAPARDTLLVNNELKGETRSSDNRGVEEGAGFSQVLEFFAALAPGGRYEVPPAAATTALTSAVAVAVALDDTSSSPSSSPNASLARRAFLRTAAVRAGRALLANATAPTEVGGAGLEANEQCYLALLQACDPATLQPTPAHSQQLSQGARAANSSGLSSRVNRSALAPVLHNDDEDAEEWYKGGAVKASAAASCRVYDITRPATSQGDKSTGDVATLELLALEAAAVLDDMRANGLLAPLPKLATPTTTTSQELEGAVDVADVSEIAGSEIGGATNDRLSSNVDGNKNNGIEGDDDLEHNVSKLNDAVLNFDENSFDEAAFDEMSAVFGEALDAAEGEEIDEDDGSGFSRPLKSNRQVYYPPPSRALQVAAARALSSTGGHWDNLDALWDAVHTGASAAAAAAAAGGAPAATAPTAAAAVVVAPPLQHAAMAAAAAAAHDEAWARATATSASASESSSVDNAGWEENGRDAAGAAGAVALCNYVTTTRARLLGPHARINSHTNVSSGEIVDASCLNGALLALVNAGRPLAALAAAHALALDYPNAPVTPSRRLFAERRSRMGSSADDSGRDNSNSASMFPAYAVRPDLGTYHAAMRAAIGCGEPDLALAVLADLKEACEGGGRKHDLKPNTETHALAAAAVSAREERTAASATQVK